MVIISCPKKFHAFNLAEQMHRHKMLSNLYTTYSSIKNPYLRIAAGRIDKENIPTGKIDTNIFLAMRLKLAKNQSEEVKIGYKYEEWVASKLKKSDYKIFIGWSATSYDAIQQAKEDGRMTILERGSSHIEYQRKILVEEYEKFNKVEKTTDERVQQELKEYEIADYIMVPSNFVRNTFLEKGFDKNKIITNPYGSSSYFTPKKKKDNKFRILYLGTISIRKGLIYLFQALQALNIPESEFEVYFIGKLNEEMRSTFDKYKQANWIFHGFINHYELSQYISNCDVFVHPSIEEGLSMVIPQTLACGIPVIATTNTGGAMVIEDGQNGFIIPIRNPDAIQEKLEYLFHNPKVLQKLKTNCLKSKQSRTWDDYGDRYANFIKSII